MTSAVSTKVDTHQSSVGVRARCEATGSDPVPFRQLRETVGGGVVWACRTAGAMNGAYEPPWMDLRRVLQAHTAPPNPQ